jgi:hypothetical protein
MTQMIKHLSRKCKALSLIPSTAKGIEGGGGTGDKWVKRSILNYVQHHQSSGKWKLYAQWDIISPYLE